MHKGVDNLKVRIKLVSKRTKKIIALALFAVISLASVVSTMALSKRVELDCGDKHISFMTISDDTDYILKQVGETKNHDDHLTRTDLPKKIHIELQKAIECTIHCNDHMCVIRSQPNTVKAILESAGFRLSPNDEISISLDKMLDCNTEFEFKQRRQIFLKDGSSEKRTVCVNLDTVHNTLNSLGVFVGEHDKVNQDLSAIISDGMEIQVDRVEVKESRVKKEIPFRSNVSENSSLEKGKVKIITPGKNGEREVTVKETILNGQVIASEEFDSVTLSEPTDEVKEIGTRPPTSRPSGSAVIHDGYFIDHFGNNVHFKRKYSGPCTAYSAPGCSTASGRPAKFGNVAVNPSEIPYGTKLYICSPDGRYVYGYATAADTGGFVYNGSGTVADLYFNSDAECCNFGRRNMCIYVL